MTYAILKDYDNDYDEIILIFKEDLFLDDIQDDIRELNRQWFENEEKLKKKYPCQGEYVLGKLHKKYNFTDTYFEEKENTLYW